MGTIGQILVLLSFIACGFSGWFYFNATRKKSAIASWESLGRKAWIISALAIVGVSILLMFLIATHQFQYNYVYSYTSLDLHWYYIISAFWAGQEGSFVLWILCNAIIGVGLIVWAKDFRAPVMAVMALCQFFLISMILGIKFGPVSLGASPFMLLAEKFPDAQMLQVPGFIPADGQGLNDLLKNIWMVIHPPTLFVGFALMTVPFAFGVAGLWEKRYSDWIHPALPWALLANLILMAGICMGGYWAYVTLSFGGYWAWDPVENSSLVPWIVGVGALHAMISYRKSDMNQKAAILLNIAAFVLVIYSTFLTRSGILGDTSVHSFVDLGLYNQLLAWILVVGFLGFGLFGQRYKDLPLPQRDINYLSREFMIFIGVLILSALAAAIILGTSAPIVGRLFQENPSAVPMEFYNKWSLPLAIFLVLSVGLGQLIWWKKMSVENVNRVLMKPLVLAVLSTAAVLVFTPFVEGTVEQGMGGFWTVYGLSIQLLMLIFCTFFALYGNGIVLWKIGRGNIKMAGGAIAHIGFVLMIFGIITSSVFNNPLSDGVNPGDREVFIVSRGETRLVEGYQVQYVGQQLSSDGNPSYILNFQDRSGRRFQVNPVTYQTRSGQWLQNPDTKHFFSKDLYVAVSPKVMYDQPGQTGQVGEFMLARGDSVVVGEQEYSVTFERFDLNMDHQGMTASTQIVVGAIVHVTNLSSGETCTIRPVYMVMEDGSQEFEQAVIEDWDLNVTFAGMQVDNETIRLVIEGVTVQEEDWVLVQAYEKPYIFLLWLGIVIMLGGFGLAIYRRVMEQQNTSQKLTA